MPKPHATQTPFWLSLPWGLIMLTLFTLPGCHYHPPRQPPPQWTTCTKMFPAQQFQELLLQTLLLQARLQHHNADSTTIYTQTQALLHHYGLTWDSARKIWTCYWQFPETLSVWFHHWERTYFPYPQPDSDTSTPRPTAPSPPLSNAP